MVSLTTDQVEPSVAKLFEPLPLRTLKLRNRIVMPPMGLHSAQGGVPGPNVAAYYRARAEGGVGLIMTEGTYIDHPVSGSTEGFMRLSSPDTVAGWARVVQQVHDAGGLIIPELWHVGLVYLTEDIISGNPLVYRPELGMVSPSGYIGIGQKVAEPMSDRDIDDVIESFVRAARNAKAIGFDGIEIHGAHGYLIDQFFWHETNHRTDRYGGSMAKRARFGADVVSAVRAEVGPDMPIAIRISQWKMQDYSARVAHDPLEVEQWLAPLVDAGVDIFDCSQRRYWIPEFEGSPLSFAGWVKKISGKPTITSGSVGLDAEVMQSLQEGKSATPASLDRLMAMLHAGEFDLVSVGRSLIADPEWPRKVAAGRFDDLIGFQPQIMQQDDSQLNYIKAD